MGLELEKNNGLTTYTVPLFSKEDKNWEDNTWLVEHLRVLANKIEERNIKVSDIGIEMSSKHKNPSIVVKGIEPK